MEIIILIGIIMNCLDGGFIKLGGKSIRRRK